MRTFVRLVVLFVFALCWGQPICAASANADALRIEISVAQGVEKYLDLLEYPVYLLVALENNGIKISNMGRGILIDGRTIQLKSAMLRFVERKGSVYVYESSFDWDSPLKHLKFEVPVEINTTSLSKGRVSIDVFLPLANFFPDVLTERIRQKIQMLSGVEVQSKMLGYFDELSKQSDSASGLQGLFSKIMLQSYSLPADTGGACAAPREPGDAEPLSDQVYLLATLAIWLIIGPAAIAAVAVWRKRKNRKQ